jgi:hypothetical protein
MWCKDSQSDMTEADAQGEIVSYQLKVATIAERTSVLKSAPFTRTNLVGFPGPNFHPHDLYVLSSSKSGDGNTYFFVVNHRRDGDAVDPFVAPGSWSTATDWSLRIMLSTTLSQCHPIPFTLQML